MPIVEKKVTVSGAYAKKKPYEYEGKHFDADIKDGDTIKILSEGEYVSGEYGEQLVVRITTRNGDKNLALNQTSINNLVDAFGKNSAEWVGKDVKVFMVKAMVSGKLQNVSYVAHKSAEMDDEGRFFIPRVETPATGGLTDKELEQIQAVESKEGVYER